jgi:hypothetical protein
MFILCNVIPKEFTRFHDTAKLMVKWLAKRIIGLRASGSLYLNPGHNPLYEKGPLGTVRN